MALKEDTYCIEIRRFYYDELLKFLEEHGYRVRRESGFLRIWMNDGQTKEDLKTVVKGFKREVVDTKIGVAPGKTVTRKRGKRTGEVTGLRVLEKEANKHGELIAFAEMDDIAVLVVIKFYNNPATPFVRWYFNKTTREFHWGHYCANLETVMADFCETLERNVWQNDNI